MAAAAESDGNDGRPMIHSSSKELLHHDLTDDLLTKPVKRNSSYQWLPPDMSELRVVLLGNSWSQRCSVANLMLGETKFNSEDEPDFLKVSGKLKGKDIVLVNTPDLLHPKISEDKLAEHVKICVRLSDPGPHVFLLVLQPEDFNEEHKVKLCTVLQLFSVRSFDHSLVWIATPREGSSVFMDKNVLDQPLKEIITMCRYRSLKQKNLELQELLTLLDQTAKDNDKKHVSCEVFKGEDTGLVMKQTSMSESIKPVLNLVLCGRIGAGKTSAAKAILGQTELHPVSNSSECVKHQGDAWGRWFSLVELPALYGKPQVTVMEESFKSILLCDPEGVHAFMLVLPMGPLIDEDKTELETIQSTFGSQVDDFTMILFTVESDPTDPAVVNFVKENIEIQEFLKTCGGRYVVLNIKEKQKIPELLEDVEKRTLEGSRCFTKDMFTKTQMVKVLKLNAELQDVKQKDEMGGDAKLSLEPFRVVLIGKTGSGKGSTANTILGKKHFKPQIAPKPANKTCVKVTGEIDGRPVILVNTPDLFDTTPSDDQIQQELHKCIGMLFPGPHVFLLVLQLGHFTKEDNDSVELIKRVFGKKSGDFIIIMFTRGDELEGRSFENYIEDCDNFVKQLLNDCGGRYQVFNNKDYTNRSQVSELLTKIESIVKKNGGSYNSEMLDDKEQIIQIQLERQLKENEEMKRKYDIVEKKHEDLKRRINEIDQEKTLQAKQLKEKDECITKEREKSKKDHAEQEKRWNKQEETQRHDWRKKLETSEKAVRSEKEQRQIAERKLEQCRNEINRIRDAWHKERKDDWEQLRQEDRQSLEEVKTSLKNLQDYNRKIRNRIYFTVIPFVLFLLCFFLAMLWKLL